MTEHMTLGVEEEFHVADAASRMLAHDGDVVLGGLEDPSAGQEGFAAEIYLSMVETATAVCSTLDELRGRLVALRRELCDAADRHGLRILAAGTMPLAPTRMQRITPRRRYRQIERLHQQVSREMMACGMHVHVGVPDRDEAVAVLNHVRPYLPLLLALSANSPFWDARDTGFASYRSVLWGRWPSADLPQQFADAAEYDAVCALLVDSGAILDRGQIYWDARLSIEHPTLEFRVSDVCMTVDEAVLQAGLCRALVRTARQRVRGGVPPPAVRWELLQAAKWRAARFGLEDLLLDPVARALRPPADCLRALLTEVADALDAEGDTTVVRDLVARTLRDGSGAARQRDAFARQGRLQDTVDLIAELTRP